MINSHSVTELYIHFVFVTYKRFKYSFDEDSLEILKNIIESKGCSLVSSGFASDHVHLLVDLRCDMSVSAFACFVKSISSSRFKLNSEDRWLGWKRGYYASSVGRSSRDKAIRYIENQ